MTQAQLASRFGLTPRQIGRIERGVTEVGKMYLLALDYLERTEGQQ